MDNTTTQTQDNGQAQTQATTQTQTTTATATQSWKSGLKTDIAGSPLLAKFADTPDGLNQAFESHANLEKLLGHEKVPLPKGADDLEGWSRFNKALGVPDKADGYGLADFNVPQGMEGLKFDKVRFADAVHKFGLTPTQAKGLWDVYTKMGVEDYSKALENHQSTVTQGINTLRGKWGDAYNSNVELGQMVINKFSTDQGMNDYVTAVLSKDPRGIEFLSKIGGQFSENKIGEFQFKNFSRTPTEALNDINKITKDPNHPYNNPKASDAEHNAAVDYVNSLWATVNRGNGQA